MSDALHSLKNWLLDRYEEFGDEVPSPQHINDVIRVVTDHFGAVPIKYLGAGDNGAAFLSNDGDIIKFTIDENEAILWHRLKNKSVSGITHLKEVANLSSSKTGDSLIYVLKAEYAPEPVTPQQARLIRAAKEIAGEEANQRLKAMKASGKVSPDDYRMQRALSFIRHFQKIADQDEAFESIPNLLMDLADKYGGYVFDLQPDNFRKNLKGEVILVDPSVPDLTGDIVKPEKLMYEEKLHLIFSVRKIYYE